MRLEVGAAELSVINLGDLSYRLKDVIRVPESKWRPLYGSLYESRLPFPSQSVLISTGRSLILVDAGDYKIFAAEGKEYVKKGYRPPPGLVSQLRRSGVAPEQVGHVVITHAHLDHFAGVTRSGGGRFVPTFPRATYHLGREDWENPETKKSLASPSSYEARTFGVLHGLGVLDLVSAEEELVPGASIIPTPGESPGHQAVMVQSEGQTAYCVGDLFHHSSEVENPEWMAPWCDALSNLKSRRAILARAAEEDALIVPAHMPPGHVRRAGRSFTYEPLASKPARSAA